MARKHRRRCSTADCQGNTNHSLTEVLLHTARTAIIPRTNHEYGRHWRHGTPPCSHDLLAGKQHEVTMMDTSGKTKHKLVVGTATPRPGHTRDMKVLCSCKKHAHPCRATQSRNSPMFHPRGMDRKCTMSTGLTNGIL